MITKEEYDKARKIVFQYEKEEIERIKAAKKAKYAGKTKNDIVSKEWTIQRWGWSQKAWSLFVVDMRDDLATIIEHRDNAEKITGYSIQRGRRIYKTYDAAF